MKEDIKEVWSGWKILPLVVVAIVITLIIFINALFGNGGAGQVVVAILLAISTYILSKGLFTLQPNEAWVLILFGKYVGTVKGDGFHWANPFSVHRGSLEMKAGTDGETNSLGLNRKFRVSLRARNFETPVLKVNDKRGNPIEIGAVVVWRVEDTAKALFDVDDYVRYVEVQSETALRHLANNYPYDHSSDEQSKERTLRDDTDTVSKALAGELQERLSLAGVIIEEARLTHLAYAPEIAGVMLRRQQAEAIISAREKIVHGAVSMVEMALNDLVDKQVVSFDEKQKAEMVGNLLVVLCGENQVESIVNVGS